VQSELYRSLGHVFKSPDVLLLVLMAPFVVSFILVIMLLFVPTAASTLAFSSTAVTLGLIGMTADLD